MAKDILLFPTLSDELVRKIRFQKTKYSFFYTDRKSVCSYKFPTVNIFYPSPIIGVLVHISAITSLALSVVQNTIFAVASFNTHKNAPFLH